MRYRISFRIVLKHKYKYLWQKKKYFFPTSRKWEVVRLHGFGKFLEFLNFLSEFDNSTSK
jgi:hypothetical protein